ncbi:hypothetical protein ACHAO8_011135 [Botrytis cinerea]
MNSLIQTPQQYQPCGAPGPTNEPYPHQRQPWPYVQPQPQPQPNAQFYAQPPAQSPAQPQPQQPQPQPQPQPNVQPYAQPPGQHQQQPLPQLPLDQAQPAPEQPQVEPQPLFNQAQLSQENPLGIPLIHLTSEYPARWTPNQVSVLQRFMTTDPDFLRFSKLNKITESTLRSFSLHNLYPLIGCSELNNRVSSSGLDILSILDTKIYRKLVDVYKKFVKKKEFVDGGEDLNGVVRLRDGRVLQHGHPEMFPNLAYNHYGYPGAFGLVGGAQMNQSPGSCSWIQQPQGIQQSYGVPQPPAFQPPPQPESHQEAPALPQTPQLPHGISRRPPLGPQFAQQSQFVHPNTLLQSPPLPPNKPQRRTLPSQSRIPLSSILNQDVQPPLPPQQELPPQQQQQQQQQTLQLPIRTIPAAITQSLKSTSPSSGWNENQMKEYLRSSNLPILEEVNENGDIQSGKLKKIEKLIAMKEAWVRLYVQLGKRPV